MAWAAKPEAEHILCADGIVTAYPTGSVRQEVVLDSAIADSGKVSQKATKGGSMGFSFKVAPGVRIRASSRGIRTSVRTRAARVHIGAGRTGFSSGAGPVSFYTSLGGGRRSGGRSGSRPPSMASYQRQLAAAQKAEEAQRLAAAFQEILNVHRTEFPPAVPPVAPPPSLPDARAVRRRHERDALAGIGTPATSSPRGGQGTRCSRLGR